MMRICFVTSGSLADYTERQSAGQTDVILCGFQALGEVSYERELKGETGLFADVALLSRERRCTVISGCFTDARGMHRTSVVVADKGRVLGVSDMVNRIDGGAYRAGAGVKIYETSAGKLGIVVAEDLYFSRVIETLSVCGADAAVCIFEQLTEGLEPVLARAQAFLCGIPVILRDAIALIRVSGNGTVPVTAAAVYHEYFRNLRVLRKDAVYCGLYRRPLLRLHGRKTGRRERNA